MTRKSTPLTARSSRDLGKPSPCPLMFPSVRSGFPTSVMPRTNQEPRSDLKFESEQMNMKELQTLAPRNYWHQCNDPASCFLPTSAATPRNATHCNAMKRDAKGTVMPSNGSVYIVLILMTRVSTQRADQSKWPRRYTSESEPPV